jgi:hypothetical protein
MSKLRPELKTANASTPCPHGVAAYLSIYNSVKGEDWGLIHGSLSDNLGHYCAIGSYFHAVNDTTALPCGLIDEVATVNDSCLSFTPKQRRTTVLRCLRWKLGQLGYRIQGRRPNS